MKIKFKGLGKIFKNTLKKWYENDPFRQSSVIAYYAIFSLPALLILIINVIGFFVGREALTGEISHQVEGIMGMETAEQVSEIIAKADETKAGIISSIIAVITIAFGATGVFVQLQQTLNQIWEVKQKATQSFLLMLKSRLFSFGLIISIGFLLLISLVVSSLLAAFSHLLEGIFPEGIAYLFYALEFIVSLAVISVLFALMFKVLPDVKMRWRDVIAGSFLTGIFFIIGKYGLSFYFGKAEPASAYGAAGSIVLILLWASYSSMILFFGAEFTKQYAVYHGTKILPTKDAEKIEKTNSNGLEQKASIKKPVHTDNGHSHEKKTEIKPKEKYSMKSKSDIMEEINRLERKLEDNKEGIKDNLKLSHLLSGLIPKAFRKNGKSGHFIPGNTTLKEIARNHISLNEPAGLFSRIKKMFQIRKD